MKPQSYENIRESRETLADEMRKEGIKPFMPGHSFITKDGTFYMYQETTGIYNRILNAIPFFSEVKKYEYVNLSRFDII
jgi:hypothetical protein